MVRLYASDIIIYKYKDYPGLEVAVGNNGEAERPNGDWNKISRFCSELTPKECVERIVSAASPYIQIPNPNWKYIYYIGSGNQGYQLTIKGEHEDYFYDVIGGFATQFTEDGVLK